MQLTPLCLVLSCLQISPDRSQFFRYDSVSLRCEDPLNSTGWKVKRKTAEGGVRPCSSGWGTASSGSTCLIGNTYPSDTGAYWCESTSGDRSLGVNITITDRAVLLQSPGLPVSEGAAVTLRCKADAPSPEHTYEFHKDGRVIASGSTGVMTIDSVSTSDEGLYACSIPGYGESLGSWMAVEGQINRLQMLNNSEKSC
ncbi:Fc receptor-like protein 5 [Etheostoma cragini]|uniref:Fc receptor-like protein 5 n=1 Tax=Etheostoma cragini TaxID=417921 RepID=UPI00155F1107|nr:Fc receptor-like protein 5 [Etheostoma cragini]